MRPSLPSWSSQTIQRQITTVGLSVTALTLALSTAGMLVHEVLARRHALERSMTKDAEIVGASTAAAIAFGVSTEANHMLRALAAAPEVTEARVFLHDGSTFARYARQPAGAGCFLHAQGPAWQWDGCGGAVVRAPVVLNGAALGTLAIVVERDPTYRALAGAIATSLLMAITSFVLSMPLWRRTARRISGPVTQLAEISERVSLEHDFRVRAPAQGSQEVSALGRSFNRMMGELQQRDDRLHQELLQRREAERRLNDLAYFDSVTGLHNRHYFRERIGAAVARARREAGRCALLYIDLDGFKQVNDALGHDAGDELLREVGRRLTDTLRRRDGVCRLGGDEFAVILDDDSDLAQVEAVAAKLVRSLALPYPMGDRPVPPVSASIGACSFPTDSDDRDSLMRHADSAMYRAKAGGKNGYCVHRRGQDDTATRAQQLTDALAQAVERSEFHLLYQPQVQLRTGGALPAITGFEALLRWTHPVLGAVSPAEFVPLAESSGAIQCIGEWVMREATEQLCRWRERYPALQMSVNLSARQLACAASVDRLCEVFRASGLPAGAVELELTESLLVDRTGPMPERLGRLRAAGLGLAVDDFGTGYSSLAYLDSFPVTMLKIDRAFVCKLNGDSQSDAIARAIIAIGSALGVEVLAEGIETPVQAQALLRLGCTRGQGFLFSAPVDALAAQALLARWAEAVDQRGAEMQPLDDAPASA
ncbi:putative bifunctional diguanylate cyclase/phosphodiesterase [Ideonella sp.]|uniref:putative bifunctional diguanylate cyclase/phosphodiesterase n=1 Tax=Ideonella sp. TaxID=1929293 RepID=UPI0035AF29A2